MHTVPNISSKMKPKHWRKIKRSIRREISFFFINIFIIGNFIEILNNKVTKILLFFFFFLQFEKTESCRKKKKCAQHTRRERMLCFRFHFFSLKSARGKKVTNDIKRNGNEQRAISEIKAPRNIRVMDQIGNERRRWLHRV